MVSLRVLILTASLVLAMESPAKLPGHINLTSRGGLFFPGVASEGSAFIGRGFALSASYIPVPEAAIGLQVSVGLEFNSYRHYFDDRVFIYHHNRGLSADLCARMSIGNRMYVLVGINALLPFYHEVDMGEKNFNHTYFFSNDSLRSRYKQSAVQASALIGIDFALGKKKQSSIGMRFTQAGNSPVKENAEYSDANGNTLIVSEKMKPASVQIYCSLLLIPRAKRRDNSADN